MSTPLFQPLRVGELELLNRVVMAPLTRSRAAQPGNIPWELNARYYAQRATKGGLIIAEATQVTPFGQGFPNTPGIHDDAQTSGWAQVVRAVHDRGAAIVLQLWHVGRVSHSSMQPGGVLPVAPSAIKPAGTAWTPDFQQTDYETPRALETDEIPALVEAYAAAARRAKAAGFDGVEIHGANGYLIEQFLQSRSNQRTDRYGGSIENRCRFLLEIADACVAVFGAGRVGVRLSPYGIANDSFEAEPMPLYSYAVAELARRGLAYLHLLEPRASGAGRGDFDHQDVPLNSELFRPLWSAALIAAGNYKPDSAAEAVASGRADAIAFGRLFISNPDLVARIRDGAPLNPYNRATFYGGGESGYVDYPALALGAG